MVAEASRLQALRGLDHDRSGGADLQVPHVGRGDAARREVVAAMREDLARFLFDQQADEYDADVAMRELAWADHHIRSFWLEQAGGVLDFLESRGVVT